jgi:hypothetical protein
MLNEMNEINESLKQGMLFSNTHKNIINESQTNPGLTMRIQEGFQEGFQEGTISRGAISKGAISKGAISRGDIPLGDTKNTKTFDATQRNKADRNAHNMCDLTVTEIQNKESNGGTELNARYQFYLNMLDRVIITRNSKNESRFNVGYVTNGGVYISIEDDTNLTLGEVTILFTETYPKFAAKKFFAIYSVTGYEHTIADYLTQLQANGDTDEEDNFLSYYWDKLSKHIDSPHYHSLAHDLTINSNNTVTFTPYKPPLDSKLPHDGWNDGWDIGACDGTTQAAKCSDSSFCKVTKSITLTRSTRDISKYTMVDVPGGAENSFVRLNMSKPINVIEKTRLPLTPKYIDLADEHVVGLYDIENNNGTYEFNFRDVYLAATTSSYATGKPYLYFGITWDFTGITIENYDGMKPKLKFFYVRDPYYTGRNSRNRKKAESIEKRDLWVSENEKFDEIKKKNNEYTKNYLNVYNPGDTRNTNIDDEAKERIKGNDKSFFGPKNKSMVVDEDILAFDCLWNNDACKNSTSTWNIPFSNFPAIPYNNSSATNTTDCWNLMNMYTWKKCLNSADQLNRWANQTLVPIFTNFDKDAFSVDNLIIMKQNSKLNIDDYISYVGGDYTPQNWSKHDIPYEQRIKSIKSSILKNRDGNWFVQNKFEQYMGATTGNVANLFKDVIASNMTQLSSRYNHLKDNSRSMRKQAKNNYTISKKFQKSAKSTKYFRWLRPLRQMYYNKELLWEGRGYKADNKARLYEDKARRTLLNTQINYVIDLAVRYALAMQDLILIDQVNRFSQQDLGIMFDINRDWQHETMHISTEWASTRKRHRTAWIGDDLQATNTDNILKPLNTFSSGKIGYDVAPSVEPSLHVKPIYAEDMDQCKYKCKKKTRDKCMAFTYKLAVNGGKNCYLYEQNNVLPNAGIMRFKSYTDASKTKEGIYYRDVKAKWAKKKGNRGNKSAFLPVLDPNDENASELFDYSDDRAAAPSQQYKEFNSDRSENKYGSSWLRNIMSGSKNKQLHKFNKNGRNIPDVFQATSGDLRHTAQCGDINTSFNCELDNDINEYPVLSTAEDKGGFHKNNPTPKETFTNMLEPFSTIEGMSRSDADDECSSSGDYTGTINYIDSVNSFDTGQYCGVLSQAQADERCRGEITTDNDLYRQYDPTRVSDEGYLTADYSANFCTDGEGSFAVDANDTIKKTGVGLAMYDMLGELTNNDTNFAGAITSTISELEDASANYLRFLDISGFDSDTLDSLTTDSHLSYLRKNYIYILWIILLLVSTIVLIVFIKRKKT